ncbi:MAG: glycosyltransferase [Phycisphaerae bacterium]
MNKDLNSTAKANVNGTSSIAVCQLTTRHAVTDNRILNLMAETLSDAGYISSVAGPHNCNTELNGVQVVACPSTSSLKGKLLRVTAPCRLLCYALADRDCSVYAIHDPDMIKIGVLLKLMGKHIVYDIHDDYEATVKTIMYKFGKPLAYIASKLWWFYEKSLTKYFDGVTVADRHLEQKFKWKSPVVLSNSPPLNFTGVADTSHENTFNMIFVGGVTNYRGVPKIVEALRLLPQPDIRFIVIGNCCDKSILDLMRSDDRVDYLGRVPWLELHKYYEKSHLGVAPYQPIPSFLYCTGENAVKIQEYMAAGIAVITSNFPGLNKFVADTEIGLTVKPDDPEDIAEKIEQLYYDRVLLKKLGANGRKAFEECYNWDLHKHKLIQLYDRITGR